MVALLRGVNVGGRSKLAMADLRRIAEVCGFEGARTYIQSGNLVFESAERSPQKVATTLEQALADARPALAPAVAVRTERQLARVVEDNPFIARDEDPAHLHVVFLGGKARARIPLDDLERYQPEEVVASRQELYLFLPGGVGRSKLAAELAKTKDQVGTMRNWRTVTKLLAMAGEVN